jgi:hypothetical protein
MPSLTLIINWRTNENKTLDDVGCHDGWLDQQGAARDH